MFSATGVMTLSFHLKSRKECGLAMLYCRLNYNGERTTEYRVGVVVPIEAWDNKTQSLTEGHALATTVQLQLAVVRAEHEQIRLELQGQLKDEIVRAAAVRDTWQQRNAPQKHKLNKPDPEATLFDTYCGFLTHLDAQPKEDRIAAKTRTNYRAVSDHLGMFLRSRRQINFLANEVTPGFGMQFYDYLRKKGLSKDTASRYLNYLKLSLHHALLYDLISRNGLFEFKPPKGSPAKRIVFLGRKALADLTSLPLVGIRDKVRKWALFMCYTGLDYKDAVKVVANDSTYRVRTSGGDKWIYQRLKYAHAPQWGECHIPVLPQAQALLEELRSRRGQPRLKVINTHLKEIATHLELPFEFSTKVCRKTAGVIFQEEGFSMQSVQKILGHQSLTVTERFYTSTQPGIVDRDMANSRTLWTHPGSPFTTIAKSFSKDSGTEVQRHAN